MILAFSGLSGSGKSTIAKMISEKLEIPTIVTCTTRPMRPGEIDGIDYHFLSDDEFSKENMVAEEHFNVAGGDVWKYGIKEKDISENDCIVVLTPKGIEDIRNSNHDIVDIMITVDDTTRKDRILKRNDNQSKEEIERRDLEDKIIFESYTPNLVVSNNFSVDRTVNSIINFINFQK